jgi:DNA (cytosine-5)-methyltransferase 1
MHYAANRKLTIKEMKRIMSLPDDYELTGTFDQQAERIGRMVAPKMMCALATSIYENILKPYKELQNDR